MSSLVVTNNYGTAVGAAGYFFLVFGTNLMLLTVRGTLVGIGGGFAFTAIMMYASMLVPPSVVPFAISILMAFMSIGGFVSGFIFAFIERSLNITSMRFPFVVGFVVLLGYSVIHTLVNLKTPKVEEHAVQQ